MSIYFSLSNIWKGNDSGYDGELLRVIKGNDNEKNSNGFTVIITSRHSINGRVTVREPKYFKTKEAVISLARLVLKDTINNCSPHWIDSYVYNITGSHFELEYDPSLYLTFPEEFSIEPNSSEEIIRISLANYLSELKIVVDKVIDNLIDLVEDFVTILDD